jgi:Ceramidase
MSQWRAWLIGAISMVFLVAALLIPAMPQPLTYHAFADCRTFFGVANFLNVVSNVPFLIGGALGLRLIWSGCGDFIDPREQLPYLVFFLGALLTCFGSAYYHGAPDNARLVWDRLPMTLGFAGLVSATIAERVDLKLGRQSLWPLLALGVFTVVYWYGTELRGSGNIIPYGIYQIWSVLIIVVLLVAYPARRYSHGALLGWAAFWYGLAKVFETFDLQIYRLLGSTLSGHTIKHVLASFAVFAIVRQLRVRHRIPRP